jgi:hypothetical protein
VSLLLGPSHDIAKARRICNLATAPADQLAGPAGDSITFCEAPVTQPNFLWDPDPSAPEDWWSSFASAPAQSTAPAALDSFGQPADITESSLENGSAKRRTASADLQGQKERSLLEHKLDANRRAQKRFRERRKVATGRHIVFLFSVLHQICCFCTCMLCSHLTATGARAST